MDIDKTISPLTNLLKKNSKIINMVLIILLISMLFPFDELLNFNPVKEVENQLSKLVVNPFVMAVLTVVIYATYKTNDYKMFALTLVLVHRLLHSASGIVSPSTPPPATILPPKAPPAPKVRAPAPPKVFLVA